MELLDTEKPITVQNFLRYIDEGLYTDGFFHRSVHNFVIQGGGFAITNRNTTNSSVTAIKTYPEILNEFKVGPLVSNTRGTIAMAKTSDPNSATSQFFVNLANNAASLDDTNNSGGFTVFGNVISGTNLFDVLNSFIGSTTIYTNVLVNAGGVFAVGGAAPLVPRLAPYIVAGGTVDIVEWFRAYAAVDLHLMVAADSRYVVPFGLSGGIEIGRSYFVSLGGWVGRAESVELKAAATGLLSLGIHTSEVTP